MLHLIYKSFQSLPILNNSFFSDRIIIITKDYSYRSFTKSSELEVYEHRLFINYMFFLETAFYQH